MSGEYISETKKDKRGRNDCDCAKTARVTLREYGKAAPSDNNCACESKTSRLNGKRVEGKCACEDAGNISNGTDKTKKEKPLILFTGGGTGGHIYPNLALIPDFKAAGYSVAMTGAADSMEERLAKRHKTDFYAVPVIKLIRSMSVKALCNNLKIPFTLKYAVKTAGEIIDAIKPAAVFSKGGFVSLPVTLAALKRGIPTFAHESDYTLGLANKIAVNRGAVCLKANPEAEFEGELTGMPLRRELTKLTKEEAREKLNIPKSKKVLLIIGGSSGAKTLNDAIAAHIDALCEKYLVIHLTGKGKKTDAECKNYMQKEYADNIFEYMKAADIIVSRAGATTVFEISALKKRALFIPLPKGISRGDQIYNARLAQKYGAAVLSEEDGILDNLLSAIEKAEQNPPMQSIQNDANGKIVRLVDATIRRGEKCQDKKPSPNG